MTDWNLFLRLSLSDFLWGDRDARFDLAGGGVIGWILVSGAYGRPLKIFKVLLYIFY
jgi:hypothetical protein